MELSTCRSRCTRGRATAEKRGIEIERGTVRLGSHRPSDSRNGKTKASLTVGRVIGGFNVRGEETRVASADEAAALIERSKFLWHQRFQLVPGVFTPGVSDVGYLMDIAEIPGDLAGMTVLDIGTTNGGAAFEFERRGAERVVAVDIADASLFGISELIAFLGSTVEFIRASVYELPAVLREPFDLVVFWGVLYHLRHPLLALDSLRELTAGTVSIETAIADHELGALRGRPCVRFYRLGELAEDSSNWFAPSVAALCEWLYSCGFEPTKVHSWPSNYPSRAIVNALVAPGQPEYQGVSYERPIRAQLIDQHDGDGNR